MLVRLPLSAACSRLIRCHTSSRVANTRAWQLVVRRSYATPGRPKKAVGETSKPVKRAAKPAAKTSTTAPATAKKVVAAKKPAAAKKAAPKKAAKQTPEQKLAQKAALKEKADKKKEAAAQKKATLKEKADKKKAAQKEKLAKQKEAQKAKLLKQRATKKKTTADTKLAELRKTALQLPKVSGNVSAYNVFVSQNSKGESASLEQSQNRMKDLAKKFQELGGQDREHYNHLANTQNAAREATLRDWVLTHSVEEIAAANAARRSLNRLFPTGKGQQDKYAVIADERAPKRPVGPYLQFYISRRASGDFKGISLIETSKLIGQDWRNLSDSEKNKYKANARAESERYAAEAPQAAAATA